jgi:hypothetical protein
MSDITTAIVNNPAIESNAPASADSVKPGKVKPGKVKPGKVKPDSVKPAKPVTDAECVDATRDILASRDMLACAAMIGKRIGRKDITGSVSDRSRALQSAIDDAKLSAIASIEASAAALKVSLARASGLPSNGSGDRLTSRDVALFALGHNPGKKDIITDGRSRLNIID